MCVLEFAGIMFKGLSTTGRPINSNSLDFVFLSHRSYRIEQQQQQYTHWCLHFLAYSLTQTTENLPSKRMTEWLNVSLSTQHRSFKLKILIQANISFSAVTTKQIVKYFRWSHETSREMNKCINNFVAKQKIKSLNVNCNKCKVKHSECMPYMSACMQYVGNAQCRCKSRTVCVHCLLFYFIAVYYVFVQ